MDASNHPDIPSLLSHLSSLTHTQRTKNLLLLGTQSKTSPTTLDLIKTLSLGDPYAQLLALKTIHGSGDLNLAFTLLSSDSKYVRRQAINTILVLGSDELVLDALKVVPEGLQKQTVARLFRSRPRRKRGGVIGRFLAWLKDEGRDGVWRDLLPFSESGEVEKGLEEVGELELGEWRRLAKCCPGVTEQMLGSLIESAEEGDILLKRVVCAVFSVWIARHSTLDFALRLVRKAGEKVPLGAFPWGWPEGNMLKRWPRQAVDLILDAKDELGTDVFMFQTGKMWRKLSLEQFLALIERYPSLLERPLFPDLSTEQKLPAYELIRVAWRDEDGVLEWDVVEYLPSEQRVAEARRHQKLKWFDTNPDKRIKYIALLPWDEAMELQKPYLRSSDAEIRSEALSWHVKAARYDSVHIEDALKLIIKHKNEAATIQRELFRALKDIPASRFKEDHLELLTQIVRNALDSPAATVALYLLMEFVGNMLSVHPSWAARQMALVVKEKAVVPGCVQLSGVVSVKDVMAILQSEMSAALETLLRKQDAAALTTLARSFEEYIEYWPKLLDTCNKTFEIPEMERSHEMMMEVVYKFKQPPGFWERIIPLLTRENKDIAGSRHIVRRIHRQYQNLLDPYIHPTEAPPSYTRKRDALDELGGGFWRWTPSQQEALAEIIMKDVANEDVTSEKKVSYIWQLGLLPAIPPSYLITLANDTRPIIQETALKALARLDSSAGVPILIEALGDDKGRIAIYALRSALKDIPKADVFSILKSVPNTKVTVAKETVRLIGDLETEEAFQWLLETEKGSLHSSVRKALLRALWSFLDRDKTWQIFTLAAQDPEPDVATGVISIPVDSMTFEIRRKHLNLLLSLLNHPAPEVRLETLKRLNSIPLSDPENVLGGKLFELVRSEYQDEVNVAIRAIFATYARTQIPLIVSLYKSLIQDRKLLIRVHDTPYISQINPRDEMKHLRPVTRAILGVLEKDRLSVKRRVKLMFEGLPWEEIKEYLEPIVSVLTPDALVFLCEQLEDEGWSAGWKRASDDYGQVCYSPLFFVVEFGIFCGFLWDDTC